MPSARSPWTTPTGALRTGAAAGPAQHPGRPAGSADHHRQLRAQFSRRRTGCSRSTRRPGQQVVAAFDGYLGRSHRPRRRDRPGRDPDQGRRAAQGGRHRLGRAALVQPAAGGAHPGAGERRGHLHEAGAGPGGRPAPRRRAGPGLLPGTRATAPPSRSGRCRRTPTLAGLHRPGRGRPAGRRGLARTRRTWTGPTSTSRTRSRGWSSTWAGRWPGCTRSPTTSPATTWWTSPPRRRSSRRSPATRTDSVRHLVDFAHAYGVAGPRRPPDLRRPVPQRPAARDLTVVTEPCDFRRRQPR